MYLNGFGSLGRAGHLKSLIGALSCCCSSIHCNLLNINNIKHTMQHESIKTGTYLWGRKIACLNTIMRLEEFLSKRIASAGETVV